MVHILARILKFGFTNMIIMTPRSEGSYKGLSLLFFIFFLPRFLVGRSSVMAGRIFIKFSVDVAKTKCNRVTCCFLQFPICSLTSTTYVILLLVLLVLRIMGGLSPNFAYISLGQLAKI